MRYSKFKHRIAVSILNLISKTWRLEIDSELPEKPALIIFWHGFMLTAWKIFSWKSAFGVVSKSRDGEILSSLLSKWGFGLLRGSSAIGGKEVLEQIVQAAKQGFVLITPDGAKGPIYKIKPGAIVASFRSGTPLYILAVKPGKSLYLRKSWDNFCIPYPFSKIRLNFSEKFIIPSESTREDIDSLLSFIEKKMNKMYEQN